MEYPTMIYKQAYDDEVEEIEVNLIASRYTNNNTLYLGIVDVEYGEPYADLTVNLDSQNINDNYLDTNNNKLVEDFVNRYKLGKFSGKYCSSGYCKYPLYTFDIKEIEKYCEIYTEEE